MKKLHIAIRNEIQAGNVLELYFLDVVDDYIDWDKWEVVSLVQDVINKVNAAKPKKIVAYINSEGGSCDIGLAIYSFLKYLNVEVETRTLALAGSIASVLAQAASPGKRYIAKSAFMVIHKAWGYGAGNGDDLRKYADVVDGYTRTIVNVYADVTGKPEADINAMIAEGDYWMDGTEAVAQGFADAVFDDVPEGFSIQNCLTSLDEHYTNIPKNLTKAEGPVLNNQTTTDTMTFKERMAAFAQSFGAKKINAKAENLAEEIAAVMAEPLQELFNGIDEDVTARINDQQEAITNAVTAAVTAAMQETITGLQQANATLTEKVGTLEGTNSKLVDELSGLKGGESGTGTKADLNAPKPIGYGVKSAAAAN